MSNFTAKYRKKVANEYAAKYGWYCFYCGVPFMHDGNKDEILVYREGFVDWEHCHCGKHDVRYEPCVLEASYDIPPGSPYTYYQIDHKMPTSRGGTNDIDNLVLSCAHCNSQKNSKTVEEYLEWLDEQP